MSIFHKTVDKFTSFQGPPFGDPWRPKDPLFPSFSLSFSVMESLHMTGDINVSPVMFLSLFFSMKEALHICYMSLLEHTFSI